MALRYGLNPLWLLSLPREDYNLVALMLAAAQEQDAERDVAVAELTSTLTINKLAQAWR